MDLFFLVDFAARFVTAYHDDYADRVVYEPAAIARHYCSGLLVPDLIASVPLTLVSIIHGYQYSLRRIPKNRLASGDLVHL